MSRRWTEAKRRLCAYCGRLYYAPRLDRQTCSRGCGVRLANLTRGRELRAESRVYVEGDIGRDEIERRYQAALKAIKARRADPLDPQAAVEAAWAQRGNAPTVSSLMEGWE
jgi:hypothetical protein